MEKMFCYQCQETAKGTGCTVRGVCGKTSDVANLQDLLLFILKGIAHYRVQLRALDAVDHSADRFILDGLFMTITNANFDKQRFVEKIKEAIKLREQLKQAFLDKGGKPRKDHVRGSLLDSQHVGRNGIESRIRGSSLHRKRGHPFFERDAHLRDEGNGCLHGTRL